VIVFFPILFIPFFFELPAVTYIVFWAVSQVFSGTLSLAQPDAAGVVLHYFFVRRGEHPPWRDEYGVAAAWVPPRHWRD